MNLNKITWVASFPKSGNTWVRMLISAYYSGGVVNINKPAFTGVDDMQLYFYNCVSPIDTNRLEEAQKVLLRPAALMHLCALIDDRNPLFVKTHCANCQIYGNNVIPQPITKKAIYIVRDPRDIAISLADHMGESLDMAIAMMNEDRYALNDESGMFQQVSSWSFNVKSWTSETSFPVHVMRYEDMISDPHAVFTDLIKFLDLPLDETLLNKSIEATSFNSLKSQEDEFGFREKSNKQKRFFTNGRAGVWKDILTDEQARRIEHDHKEIMKKFNYTKGKTKNE